MALSILPKSTYKHATSISVPATMLRVSAPTLICVNSVVIGIPDGPRRRQRAESRRSGVTNRGSRSGADVAQLYVGDPVSSEEPPRQLKAFTKGG